jgi:2-iminobutanoate/2-iminopropanoate deaminase
MTRKIITSSHAPEPIGPYSQAIQFGNLLFTSGQIAIDANTSELILGNIAEQTKQVLKNLSAVLAAGGASPDSVLKTTIYLKNMGDFSVVNEIYSQFFAKALPARSTVEVSRLPKDVLVEIDCIAFVE